MPSKFMNVPVKLSTEIKVSFNVINKFMSFFLSLTVYCTGINNIKGRSNYTYECFELIFVQPKRVKKEGRLEDM